MHQRTRRKINWFVIGLICLPLIGIGAYLWTSILMSSAQDYRSPLAKISIKAGVEINNPQTRKVVLVIIDGLRLDTSLDQAVMPFITSLRKSGASARMISKPPSFSAPSWTTILTGAWPDINDSQLFNPADNSSTRIFTQDNIFSAINRKGDKSAVSGFVWFKDMLANSGVDSGFYTEEVDRFADEEVVKAALQWLKGDYELVLVLLDQVDFAGHHEGGPMDPRWAAAASRTDALIKELTSSLDLTEDTIIILSDHGHIDQRGHGGSDPITMEEPFIIAGAGIIPGNYPDILMVDIAPTISALLGSSIPSSNEGSALYDMLSMTPDQKSVVMDAIALQQNQLLNAYFKSVGFANVNLETTSVDQTQKLMTQARMNRLGKERIWRNVLAAFVIILPGYMLFLRKDKKVLWFCLGGFVYLSLFILRYGIIDEHAFSIASIESASWFIIYVGTTSLITILISWIIPMIKLNGFSMGPRKSVEITLGFVWFTIYLLSMPILVSFALNGFKVTWTLPEFLSMYLALLALIQVIFIAFGGLLLSGLAAGLSSLATRKRTSME